MTDPANHHRLLRFGVFQVDLRSCELRKQGLKIKLQDQPCQILAVLLEKPGEIVTREELRSKLWHGDTFVDFDHSLNTAMMRLREALGDSPENPVFVEDLVRDIAARSDRDPNILWYRVEAENFESIHHHNAYARIERRKAEGKS